MTDGILNLKTTVVREDSLKMSCFALLNSYLPFLADRTIGRAYGTVCRLSVCL